MIRKSGISLFSVDVEDWYNILDLDTAPAFATWDELPSRVENNFLQLLDLFAEHKVKTTCFFLAHTATKYPHLVRRAYAAGHEIASHGCRHELVYELGRGKFATDARVSKEIIENICGAPVYGYRAAGFSVTEKTPWFFDEVSAAGYVYDSSIFPGARQHGGMQSAKFDPHLIQTAGGPLVEIPISLNLVFGRAMCFVGGGYLRLFPYSVIRWFARSIHESGRAVTYYIHPRDIDVGQPRIPMSAFRSFKSYVGLGRAKKKVARILDADNFQTYHQHSLALIRNSDTDRFSGDSP